MVRQLTTTLILGALVLTLEEAGAKDPAEIEVRIVASAVTGFNNRAVVRQTEEGPQLVILQRETERILPLEGEMKRTFEQVLTHPEQALWEDFLGRVVSVHPNSFEIRMDGEKPAAVLARVHSSVFDAYQAKVVSSTPVATPIELMKPLSQTHTFPSLGFIRYDDASDGVTSRIGMPDPKVIPVIVWQADGNQVRVTTALDLLNYQKEGARPNEYGDLLGWQEAQPKVRTFTLDGALIEEFSKMNPKLGVNALFQQLSDSLRKMKKLGNTSEDAVAWLASAAHKRGSRIEMDSVPLDYPEDIETLNDLFVKVKHAVAVGVCGFSKLK